MMPSMAVDYDRFFEQTRKVVPRSDKVKASSLWAAVLLHSNLPQDPILEDNFLWVKCSGKTIVQQVSDVYVQRTEQQVALAHEGELLTDTSVLLKSLDTRGHRIVVLEAIYHKDLEARLKNTPRPLRERNVQSVSNMNIPAVQNREKAEVNPPVSDKDEVANRPMDQIRRENFAPSPTSNSDNGTSKKLHSSPSPQAVATCDSSLETIAPENQRKDAQTAPEPSQATLEAHRKAFCIVSPPTNLPFLKFRDWYLENTPSARYFSPQYVHDMAWSIWQEKEHRDRREFSNAALAEMDKSDRPEGWFSDAFQSVKPPGPEPQSEPEADADVKPEIDFESHFDNVEGESQDVHNLSRSSKNFNLQTLFFDSALETLENCVEEGVKFLDELGSPIVGNVGMSKEAEQWASQIDKLRASVVRTKTVIGVVGNTGAGKSSVINAMLDEERLVPTNAMRACTAVVTELSYNYGNTQYKAEIEFISLEDWLKEMKVLFDDLLDGSGEVSREATIEDSDAGVAYAKIKAVYPRLTRDEIANSNIEELAAEVKGFLGSTKKFEGDNSTTFYQGLQKYVDSKEKNTGKKPKGEKKEPNQREYWPLIKVVRIYVKSPALETGAVIVDLPGVHDANAARAAVAEGYIKQCTGLWIVAPIIRAVDDKAAKKLLGDSFKRQLKMDGGYSSVTFICSKTDDISLTEASDSLGLNEQNGPIWDQMDNFDDTISRLDKNIIAFQETKTTYNDVVQDIDDQIETWEELHERLSNGNTVFRPGNRKRKRSGSDSPERKKKRSQGNSRGSDSDFVSESEEDKRSDGDDDDEIGGTGEPTMELLTEDQIVEKLNELKATKKEARRERNVLTDKLKHIRQQIKEAKQGKKELEAQISRVCIEGRNKYSKGAIQQDFAAGIKELDQEIAAEEDEENFDPDVDARDYDEVAQSLPVFCVSSRGYQKLQGRLQRDADVNGFTTIEQTEIPALQAHCKQLTVAGRTSACKSFMTKLSQLLNSLTLWASNDGTGANMTAEQRETEAKVLQRSLSKLEACFEKLVESTKKELAEELGDNIFDRFPSAVESAREEAVKTCQQWAMPVNRTDRSAGGFFWATYKAICRRHGLFNNAQGQHDLNAQLVEPIIRAIASGWERTFTRKTQIVLKKFSNTASELLKSFHKDVNLRAQKTGTGVAGLLMLEQQLGNYEEIFGNTATAVREEINKTQKDINREFTPVITEAMTAAYNECTGERGPGSFARMKGHMARHVDHQRMTMFDESCSTVKKMLKDLLTSVEDTLANTTDEVFLAISRDYRSIIGGGDVCIEGETIPKWQRDMRRDVMKVIDMAEAVFTKAAGNQLAQDNDQDQAQAQVQRDDVEVGGDHAPKSRIDRSPSLESLESILGGPSKQEVSLKIESV